MRSFPDRLRHALSFEALALLLTVPLGALLFGLAPLQAGALGVLGACIATAWTYAFNLGFDRVLVRFGRSTLKTPRLRLLHAALLEAGLLVVLLPAIRLCAGVGVQEAVAIHLTFSAFFLLYAVAFNWAYDRLFPLPAWQVED